MYDRRQFLKSVALGVSALVIPFGDNGSKKLLLSPEARLIEYSGPKITLNELYSMVAETFDDMICMGYPNAMLPVNRLHYTMENGWKITEDSIPLLTEGCLEQGDELYSSIVEIKHVECIKPVGMPYVRQSGLPTLRRG
jgi:hypothetical protein